MRKIVIIGGRRSFIGRHLIAHLQQEHRLAGKPIDIVATTSSQSVNSNTEPVRISDIDAIQRVCEGATDIVNVAGILTASSRNTFENVHDLGARNVAQVAKRVGARFVSLSAIGADPDSSIPYFRSKGRGEAAIKTICFDNALILRPSIVFGPGDSFFNRLNKVTKWLPVAPVFGGGASRFQPIHVEDLAQCIAVGLRKMMACKSIPTSVYEIGGPQILSYRQMIEMLLEAAGRRRPIMSLPYSIGSLQGAVLERLPPSVFTITRDQIQQLQLDNVCRPQEFAKALNYFCMRKEDLKTVNAGLKEYIHQ